MSPEFFLILEADSLGEQLENSVYEAGFDDSSLTMRRGKAAIWVCHRHGELTDLMRQALSQARQAGLNVAHVEIESGVLA